MHLEMTFNYYNLHHKYKLTVFILISDSTDYQDEFSLDGVPETSKSLNIDMKKQQSQAQVESSSVSKTFSSHYPITSNNGTVATKPNAIAYDCSQDGDDENTQDGESMMMQMEEFDENGCSQIRNVSLEELVDSGHIILDGKFKNDWSSLIVF